MTIFLIRHGETEWSLSGQHTGITDIPLTENGRKLAENLRSILHPEMFSLVLDSPLQRAHETCKIAGLAARAAVDRDLMEWNYGTYEGLTQKEIDKLAPGWMVFRDGCPGGETPQQVAARVDRVIARVKAQTGNVALFSHGHVLRVFAARWIGLPPQDGQHFLLDTGTISILDYYLGVPAIKLWNFTPPESHQYAETGTRPAAS